MTHLLPYLPSTTITFAWTLPWPNVFWMLPSERSIMVPTPPRTDDWAPSEPSNSSIPNSICPHVHVQGLLKLTLARYGLGNRMEVPPKIFPHTCIIMCFVFTDIVSTHKYLVLRKRDGGSNLALFIHWTTLLLRAHARHCPGLEATMMSKDNHIPAFTNLIDRREK